MGRRGHGRGRTLGRSRLVFGIGRCAVLGVVAGKVPHTTGAVEDEDVVDQLVHEIPVVAHQQETTGEVQQEFLEDAQREDVEVVGGFVEDEKVRIGHQHPQEVKAFAFAPTELVDEVVVPVPGKQEALEQLAGR